MLRLQAYKFELRPNGAQMRDMARTAGSCRYVYNRALAMKQAKYAESAENLRVFDLINAMKIWKDDEATSWLKDAPSQALQQSIKDMDRAYQNFFSKRAAFPRFKKKGMSCSFRFPQGVKLEQDNNRVFLPKLGWIHYRNSREVLGVIKNATVSCVNGKWYVSLQTEREVAEALHPATSSISIDLGVARFATMSDGSFLSPLDSFRKKQSKLARYQRAMARKVKFSKNWHKAKQRVSKLHTHIANARRDFLHKASATISKNHALVFVEDLKVANMSKSASGTMDAPGRSVRAKSGLNKAILDQGWFEFRRQLEYKLAWQGGQLVAVPPHYTSQTCPRCGHVARDNRKTQSVFACVDCGYTNNADVVGAMNIKAAGHAVLAYGELAQSGHSMKYEPAEVATQEPAHA
ncbi:MAG: hypothetical protein CTY38_01135 [Methylotenera sp.]|uniref:RNA-guided endonuclease InsQ/TnpB family protein n=1 Tax=Methylotenera sp. TaxID=2051956 RepID=UPI000D4194B4|nr:transposase [Methylotenera sp.]PPC84681.1 MAG: hypothetical protein CTY38_01135 [Methylotenera sp.]